VTLEAAILRREKSNDCRQRTRVTRSKFDLRISTQDGTLAAGAVSPHTMIVNQWLHLLVGFASGTIRRPRLTLTPP
jgi:hypothetical protein